MALSKQEICSSYDSGARYYNFVLKLYGLIGIRKAYRLGAVNLLRLKRGDCVVELGYGTGINFPFIPGDLEFSYRLARLCKGRGKGGGGKDIHRIQ